MTDCNRSDQKKLQPKDVCDWTVMVYMAGDNNLSADCIWALTEMKKLRGVEDINIIAQFDPSDGRARTRRYNIAASEVDLHEEELPLAHYAFDFATYDPETGEVSFKTESPKAVNLREKRQERRNEPPKKDAVPLETEGTSDITGASINDTNTASPVTLYNFLSYGVHFFPARHYIVVLSAHSGGIEPSYLMKDESSGAYMSFHDLKRVFKQLNCDFADETLPKDGRATKIDILGFDSCLMSMAEVCYELRDNVGIVVGSETYTPSSGWPYLQILQGMKDGSSRAAGVAEYESTAARSPLSPAEVATKIVDNYVKFYRDYAEAGVAVALSAMRVEKLSGLISRVRRLTKAMVDELSEEHPDLGRKSGPPLRPFTDALILAHWEAQSYNGEWYVDLVDFCECLLKRTSNADVSESCKDIVEFVDKELVIKSAFTGADYQFSRGVSVYFPWSTVAPYLFQFEFAEKSGWGEFLAHYTNLTRRKFRLPADPKDLTDDQREHIRILEQYGANFVNYVRKDKGNLLEFNKMGSDKMATSDRELLVKMGSDKMGSDKMGSDKMGSDKMGSDKSGNPIHSMRNPPLVWFDADARALGVAKGAKASG